MQVASFKLHLLCKLQVGSCIYYASYELQVTLNLPVASFELNKTCQFETQKASCIQNFELRVLLKERFFHQTDREAAFQFGTVF